jgi:hypothetical protein
VIEIKLPALAQSGMIAFGSRRQIMNVPGNTDKVRLILKLLTSILSIKRGGIRQNNREKGSSASPASASIKIPGKHHQSYDGQFGYVQIVHP